MTKLVRACLVASVMSDSLRPHGLFVSRNPMDQAPLSMGFFRQEYWSGLPWPPPGMTNLDSVLKKQRHCPSVPWDLALGTCNLKYLLLWLMSFRPQRNECFFYISFPTVWKWKVTACQCHGGLWHVQLLTSDTLNALEYRERLSD